MRWRCEHLAGDGRGRHAGLCWGEIAARGKGTAAGGSFLDALQRSLPKGLSFAAARESAEGAHRRGCRGAPEFGERYPRRRILQYAAVLETPAPLAILRKVVGHNGGVRRRASPRRATSASCSRTEDAWACIRRRRAPPSMRANARRAARFGDDERELSGAFPAARDVRGNDHQRE